MSSVFIKLHLIAGTNAVQFDWATGFTMIDCIKVYTPYTVAFGNYNLSSSIVTNIAPSTTASTFLDAILIANQTSVTLSKNSTPLAMGSLVGTGTSILVSKGIQNTSYSIVIYGDVSGDGVISVSDMLAVKKHLVGLNLLTGDYLKAGKVTRQSSIEVGDLAAIKSNILKISTISQS
jgi:hypothetical protein